MNAIEIVAPDPTWAAQFGALAAQIRAALGEGALRIDHIGSTAVPGLAAKDIIDVQVTVAAFGDVLDRLAGAGLRPSEIRSDHRPPGSDVSDDELEKRFANAAEGDRRANVHIRVDGRFNQRYALLCRDYLRAHPNAAAAYGEVKRHLARIVVDDIDAYYDVKDPVFDIIMAGAEEWAAATEWSVGPRDVTSVAQL